MENDGYITIGTKIDTDNFDSQIGKMEKSLKNKMSSIEQTITKTFNLIKTSIIGAGIGLAVKAVADNLDDAIKRLDTLKNYTKVMSNLGISADKAEASMNRLSEALTGLPTTMDDAVSSVQRFTSANGDIGVSTEMFLALNNAILAGGGSAQTQASALEQLSQSYAKGRPDMMEWRTAMSAMPAQLKQVAMAMGYVSADKLGQALRSGKVSMNDFMIQLVKLNKEGVAGFQSFEQQARNATGGIGTSIQNVKTAITRGIAQVLDAIGQANIAGFFQGIVKAINKTIPYITAFVKLIATGINYIATLFGKQVNTSVENTTANIEDTSSAVSSLNSNVEATSDDMSDTTKKAKKLNKALGNLQKFDELNILQSASDTNNTKNALGSMDLSGLSLQLEEANKDTGNLLDNLSGKFKEITDLFSKGFELSFGNMNFEKIIAHVQNIKEQLISIGTDPTVINSAQGWAEILISSLGSITGSVARIGKNIAEMFYGSIDGYLKQNSPRIKSFITSMFQISSKDMQLEANFAGVIGTLSDVFAGDSAKQIGANILTSIINPIMSIRQVLSGLAVDFKKLVYQPIIDNSEGIKTALEGTLGVYEKVTGTFASAYTSVGDTIQKVYEEKIKPFMDKITVAFSDTFGKFVTVYNENIKPVLDELAQKFDELWKQKLQPAFDKIGSAIGTIFEWIGTYWTQVLKPIIDWIIANVVPLISTVIGESIKGLFDQLGNLADILGGLANIVKGVYEVAVGIFTWDWDKIKDGASNVLKGFKNIGKGLVNIVKTFFKTFTNVWSPVIDWLYDNIFYPIETTWNELWHNISSFVEDVVDWIKDLFWTWFEWLNNKIFTPIQTIFTNLWENMKNGANKFITGAMNVFYSWKEWINTHVITPVESFFINMWDNIKTKIQTFITNIKNIFEGWKNWININIVEKLKTIFETLWNSITTSVNNIWTTVNKIFAWIKDGARNVWSNIVGVLSTGYNWLNDHIINPVKTAIGTIWETLKSGASNAWNTVKGIFSTVATFFQNTFSNAWNAVKNVFTRGGQVFNTITESISSTFKAVVNHLIDGINTVVRVPFEKINTALDTLKGVTIFGQRPFWNLPTIPIPNIPKLAKGTILNAPGKGTLVAGGSAIAGEAGREAYLPLSDTQLLEELGSTIGKYITINANIVNEMNGRVISREIKRIQNDENFAYNI